MGGCRVKGVNEEKKKKKDCGLSEGRRESLPLLKHEDLRGGAERRESERSSVLLERVRQSTGECV